MKNCYYFPMVTDRLTVMQANGKEIESNKTAVCELKTYILPSPEWEFVKKMHLLPVIDLTMLLVVGYMVSSQRLAFL